MAKQEELILEKIYNYSLSEIMGERFGAYSKYIIQDRAIPDVRDGLKPVQRRILYGMYKDHNTYDKAYKKSAKTVGNVMGKYHPHGDSSIYEAMVRLSADWKQNTPFVDMQGNNGSIDGDPPAAYRYTEARLAKISEELLKDIDRNTVEMALTFDDSDYEPTVLPAKFPNLLVNGSSGISAGYATNIPPHNLSEVIDATIKRIEDPEITLSKILKVIKGPDFPTGGIACGIDEIKKCYKTGKGRIVVNSKTRFEKGKKVDHLIVEEIPYDVNKAKMVEKIDSIRLSKKLDGLLEVRDESDRDGIRIVIDLKKGADQELILNYLLKNTELQKAFNYNAVAIVDRTPKTLSLLEILDAYIKHLKEVIIRRSRFDLDFALKRFHIVEGLIKALSILDEVIKVIRKSKNKSDAKINLVKEFKFTEEQAEAIVMLQLYRLTNTDIKELEEELERLNKTIKMLKLILENEEALRKVMIEELKRVKKEFSTKRKTLIEEEVEEIKIDKKEMIAEEDVVVTLSKDGYIKRSSIRSFSQTEDVILKDKDYYLNLFKLTTLDTIIVFTDLGNYLFLPVHEIPNHPYKELGTHVSNIVTLDADEKVINAVAVSDFINTNLVCATKNGMIKKLSVKDLEVKRYSKTFSYINLEKDDKVVFIDEDTNEVLFLSKNNMALRIKTDDISVTGLNSKGVIGIRLDKDDYLVSFNSYKNESYLVHASTNGTIKRLKVENITYGRRTNKGSRIQRIVKSNPYYSLKALFLNIQDNLGIVSSDTKKELKLSDIPIKEIDQVGSSFAKSLEDIYKVIDEEKDIEEVISEEDINIDEIDEKIKEVDEVLKDYE